MLIVGAIILLIFVLPSPWGYIVLAAAVAAEIAELMVWRRVLGRHRVVTGKEGLVGERAEVVEACRPIGTVRMRGEIWNASSPQGADPGEVVLVTEVDGLTLTVGPSENGKGPLEGAP